MIKTLILYVFQGHNIGQGEPNCCFFAPDFKWFQLHTLCTHAKDWMDSNLICYQLNEGTRPRSKSFYPKGPKKAGGDTQQLHDSCVTLVVRIHRGQPFADCFCSFQSCFWAGSTSNQPWVAEDLLGDGTRVLERGILPELVNPMVLETGQLPSRLGSLNQGLSGTVIAAIYWRVESTCSFRLFLPVFCEGGWSWRLCDDVVDFFFSLSCLSFC